MVLQCDWSEILDSFSVIAQIIAIAVCSDHKLGISVLFLISFGTCMADNPHNLRLINKTKMSKETIIEHFWKESPVSTAGESSVQRTLW